ncbi:hypothetical protein D3C85_1394050 [compost metagenome]
MTVNSLRPWLSLVCEMEASIGNSLPSRRRPKRVRCWPICRSDTPVTPKRLTCVACEARNRLGISRSSGFPTASDAEMPNSASAMGLKSTMLCPSFTEIMASMEVRTIAEKHASFPVI